METKNCQVIVRVGPIAMFLNRLAEHFDDLTSCKILSICHLLEQPFVAELNLLRIHGLVETVGVDEYLFASNVGDCLTLERQIVEESEGAVLMSELYELTSKDWWIMSAVAEIKLSGLEVYYADEHRDEHHRVVALTEAAIHTIGNGFR